MSQCIFSGYYHHHKDYMCYDPLTNKLIILRHVVFDELSFLGFECFTFSKWMPQANPLPPRLLIPAASTSVASICLPPDSTPRENSFYHIDFDPPFII